VGRKTRSLYPSIDIYFQHLSFSEFNIMPTAKLFQNGRSQAVRLPKEFRLPGKEVKISKQGNKIILEPIETSWEQWFEAMNQFSDDFMTDGRNQPEQAQERDWD